MNKVLKLIAVCAALFQISTIASSAEDPQRFYYVCALEFNEDFYQPNNGNWRGKFPVHIMVSDVIVDDSDNTNGRWRKARRLFYGTEPSAGKDGLVLDAESYDRDGYCLMYRHLTGDPRYFSTVESFYRQRSPEFNGTIRTIQIVKGLEAKPYWFDAEDTIPAEQFLNR